MQVKVLAAPKSGMASGQAPWHLQFSVRDTGIASVDRLPGCSNLQSGRRIHHAPLRRQLGLAISKRLVELMGGKMGRACRKRLHLPLHAATGGSQSAPAARGVTPTAVGGSAPAHQMITPPTAVSRWASKWGMLRGAQSASQV